MAQRPLTLVGRDHTSIAQSTVIKTVDEGLWQTLLAQQGKLILVNEPMAMALELELGQALSIKVGEQRVDFMIAGIYYDHGKQAFEAVIQENLWHQLNLSALPRRLAVHCARCNPDDLATELAGSLKLSRAQVYSQPHILQLALTLFGRTFAITSSLGSLTLLVAAIGLFSALTMLSASRETALSRLHALGVSRGALFVMSTTQILLMVLVTALLAIPVAWILAWLLIHKLILLAFGWSLIMDWQWLPALLAIATALLTAALALIWPLWRQSRRALCRSLQQEVM